MFAELSEGTLQTSCPSGLRCMFFRNKIHFFHEHSAVFRVRSFNSAPILNTPYLKVAIIPMVFYMADLILGSMLWAGTHAAFGCFGSAHPEPSLDPSSSS